ncbi:MAG: c-type cytochrome [Gemmatimonadaceae bacterium]|nr:c-type cytochrome [Gemmatimonadaceae bacterium]MCW5827620.1 c-type cytochrome [Gemmatimonadaceae bacterium]
MSTFQILAVALVAFVTARVQAQEPAVSGELTFRVVCAACHTLNPPYEKAPPMTHIARHYRQAFTTEAEGVEAIVQWVLKPDAARSKMPAHAIERFGIMPAFPLPEAQLRDVAKYVWDLGAPAAATAPAANAPQHQHRPPR